MEIHGFFAWLFFLVGVFVSLMLIIVAVFNLLEKYRNSKTGYQRKKSGFEDNIYEGYCDHCEDLTQQEYHESGHERDSSNDWRICLKCGWRYSGYSGKWSAPIEIED